MSVKLSSMVRRLLLSVAVLGAATAFASPARAAFHLWDIREIYSNSSGTLQFIEFTTASSSQQFVGGQTVSSINIGATITNNFNIPSNLPGDSLNRRFLIGTAGIQALGAPAPDYTMPNGFLFTAGGTLNFFGTNSGPYAAMPTDGTLSRIWNGGTQINSPENFAGQIGQIVVPEPTTLLLTPLAAGLFAAYRRRSRCTNVV